MFWLAEVFNGGVSQEEMRRYELWARRQRAEAVHEMAAAAGRGLVRTVKAASTGAVALARTYQRWHQRRAAIRELQALSDHVLKDIGLSRGEIRGTVDQLLQGKREQTTAQAAANPQVESIRTARPSSDGGSESEWQRAA